MKHTTPHYGHNGWAVPLSYERNQTASMVANCITAASIAVLCVVLGAATLAYAVEALVR